MILNYFHIALRNLLKHKLHTVINVLGLAFGIASVFLITLYVSRELSYDRFHERAEDLYRITWEDDNPQTRTPHPMAQGMVEDFPEVEDAVSFTPLWGSGLIQETHSFHNLEKDIRYDERNILAVDTSFFRVFRFPIVKGNPKTALKSVTGLLISESIAKKYFGDEDPIGKHLSVDGNAAVLEVVAVFKDVPAESHFHFDFLVSYVREKFLDADDSFYDWPDFGHFNYIRVRPGADVKALEAKLLPWVGKHSNWSPDVMASLVEQGYTFRLQPVTDIHLGSRLRWELEPNGNREYIYILAAAALLILTIACVNFTNLTTARSAERAKEIGIRKTLGAFRRQLSLQFLTESVVIALIAMAIAILIVECVLPFFNAVTGTTFEIHYGRYFLILLILGVFIGLISGIYPSLYLSGIRPQLMLKGRLTQAPGGAALRKGLIVFQFAVSMILISAAVIIFKQLDFLRNKNLGFNKEEVIVIPVKGEEGIHRMDAFRNELLSIKGITQVSTTTNIPGRQFNQNPIVSAEFPKDEIGSSEAMVDYDFFKTLGIDMAEGRAFSRENLADRSGAFILNETAVRQLNLSAPVIGKEILWDRDETLLRGKVIGVVKDFHFQSLHEPIRPLLFAFSEKNYNYILIRINTQNFDEVLAAIEKTYRSFEDTFGFEFTFLEDYLNQQYAAEARTGNIFGTFSFIAIIIASFGLFAMAMLTFQQKVKEVSIRKVLGATVPNLLVLLLGGFTKLIFIAILLAIPLTWWMMDRWLDNFSYQVTIHPFVFVVSGLLLLLISWITLSYLTLKTSRLNPAETLKSE